MTDLLEQASAWLDDQRDKYLSRSVLYVRGASSVQVPATIGSTVFAVDDGAGASIRVESRDYLVRGAYLLLDGTAVVPRRGDQIHELQDGVMFVYEVMAPGDEPCWRYSDPYRRVLRVHTKQVEVNQP